MKRARHTTEGLAANIAPSPGELSSLGYRDLLTLPVDQRWRGVVLLVGWVLVLVLAIVTGIVVLEADLTALPISVAGIEAYVTIYPPLIFCTLLLFWLGFWWAFIPAYISTLVIALYSGMAAGWAILFAFSDIVGLAFLAIAYRSTGNGFDVRRAGSIAFFLVASFVAALAGATGSFIWSHTRGLDPMETFAVWEGWWLGAFLQTVLICGPLLFLFTPVISRLKTRWFGLSVYLQRGATILTIAVVTSVLLVCAFLIANAHLLRLRLERLYSEGYPAKELAAFGDSSLLNIALVSVLLIVACGLGFLGLTARWKRELEREVRARTRILDQSRKQIRDIINLVPHMIYARDQQGEFVMANRATSRMLGHSADELASSDRIALAASLPQLEAMTEREAAIFAGESESNEAIEIVSDAMGEERRLRTSRLLLDRDPAVGPLVLTVAVDVTDQERSEETQRKLIAELADKNRELERFTYTVSHDLKSPIITIRGFAHQMERQLDAGDAEQMREDLARIQKASARMQKLLDGLLVLSRSGKLSGPRQSVDLARLAEEVVEIMAGQIEASGATIEIMPDMPPVSGDSVRLFELVQNLLDNAIKFADAGRPPHVVLGCDEQDEELRFFVEDNGIGIRPDDRERIFGLFEQAEASASGTGIGLALARRIVEVHGGRIWVEEAASGAGARFVFVLPAAGARA